MARLSTKKGGTLPTVDEDEDDEFFRGAFDSRDRGAPLAGRAPAAKPTPTPTQTQQTASISDSAPAAAAMKPLPFRQLLQRPSRVPSYASTPVESMETCRTLATARAVRSMPPEEKAARASSLDALAALPPDERLRMIRRAHKAKAEVSRRVSAAVEAESLETARRGERPRTPREVEDHVGRVGWEILAEVVAAERAEEALLKAIRDKSAAKAKVTLGGAAGSGGGAAVAKGATPGFGSAIAAAGAKAPAKDQGGGVSGVPKGRASSVLGKLGLMR